jgi:integrase
MCSLSNSSWLVSRGYISPAPTRFGPTRKRRQSTRSLPPTFISPACWRCGRDSYSAISCACRYDGTHIRLRQSKTGTFVTIPVGAPLMLDAAPRRSPIILLNSDGRPWTAQGFSSSWRKACARTGIVGVTFHDLRGTAVTQLALVGCTEPEIATITGLSLQSVRAILGLLRVARVDATAPS